MPCVKNVLTDDVISALLDGEVIEKYPDDKPFPSCLVYGRAKDRKPLHVVCALPTHVDILEGGKKILPVFAAKQSAFIFLLLVAAIILSTLYLSLKGVRKPTIRRLPALDAIEEAVGRATEMVDQYTFPQALRP
ncbi:MAG: hypothetical protein AOA65_0877 [Candidatus Bathyarchaeota archaeon BA1]|nr:MAG: hypothetical protein AOA65_0877 [Candidatus Bathyarchaeota archaeon BA1]